MTLLRQTEENEEGGGEFPTAMLYTDSPFIDSETL